MRMWQLFWTACFLVAGTSFAVIAAVVLVRGIQDLKEMIGLLEQEKRVHDAETRPPSPAD
jgi:hypothetical protein